MNIDGQTYVYLEKTGTVNQMTTGCQFPRNISVNVQGRRTRFRPEYIKSQDYVPLIDLLLLITNFN